ncbi:MAG: response regulator transcription factor [Ruminococcaceae bacterium]|nr:response regulator transcription factor [Oscillospiraceae bacterium]
MYTILICDDEKDIRNALRIYLTAERYRVLEAENGEEALALLETEPVHLVLMDIMMPLLDGMTATERLREQYNIPVILLTAKSEDTDKILGLTVGADDYVTKPFNPMELLARVRAQLRRYTMLGGLPKHDDVLRAGGIELDDRAKTVALDGEPVTLTPTEYEILKLLLQNPNRVYSSAEIYRAVWGADPLGSDGTIAVHIRHLREKLEINPSEPRYLKVVWGQGYKLEVQP